MACCCTDTAGTESDSVDNIDDTDPKPAAAAEEFVVIKFFQLVEAKPPHLYPARRSRGMAPDLFVNHAIATAIDRQAQRQASLNALLGEISRAFDRLDDLDSADPARNDLVCEAVRTALRAPPREAIWLLEMIAARTAIDFRTRLKAGDECKSRLDSIHGLYSTT